MLTGNKQRMFICQRPFCGQTLLPLIVLACALSAREAYSQSGVSPAIEKPSSASSLTKPGYLPEGAVLDGTGYSSPMPLANQWETFFAWIIHLDQAAAEHENQGKDGSWLRNHLVEALGLDQAEADLIRQAAHRNQADMKAYDDKIVATIVANRANSSTTQPSPGTQELLHQRTTAIMNLVSDLENNLGTAATAKLENWREIHFGGTYQTVMQRPLPPAAVKALQEFKVRQAEKSRQQIREHQPQRSEEQRKTSEVNQ